MSDQEEEVEDEVADGDVDEDQEPPDNPLSSEVAGECLSLLCKTGNGLAHAFVRLDIKNKKLTDIAILNCYVHVRYLDVSGNKLKDISAINALPHLLTLTADSNRLTSAKFEEFKYLQWASFAHNEITTTEGIAQPQLEKLNLSFNKISEVQGLVKENLPMLQVLDLHGNQLTSIAGLDIPTLRELYVASNQLTGFQGLENLPQLTTLHARGNQIAQLDGFTSTMESLQYLNLRSNTVELLTEVEKLQCLPLLRVISFAECPVSEVNDYRVEVLVRLRKLEKLDKDPYTEDERADAEEVSSQRQAELAEQLEAED